ncbi:Hint domain-containing protein [Celeribacter marinus]|uniref:Alkaline phosphatase n=1 Tax=Celeribacter marinus TaxID=1397108 RepID=A0A0P0A0P6_9RHOB|nr:Hint domain-containing protein [Celeribacter marinus]ALI56295.1 alkaline phosphatase [Celeribacter marinus]SFK82975.1 Ca2+-binding protein, RTX toxin-related [Celeribacter marinus]
MATYILKGYAASSLSSTSGNLTAQVGHVWRLDPSWDNSNDHLTYTINDDDVRFGGDATINEVGDDFTQTAVVTNVSGGTVASGGVYLEDQITLSDGQGNLFDVYSVEIGGTQVGVVSNPELVPGVTYQVSSVSNVSAFNLPDYVDMATPTYDPDLAQTYNGGAYNDEIVAGAGDDIINAGAGADSIEGGAGNDTIYYGTGGATQADGDTVYGGDGDDIIDDEAVVQHNYDDTLYGGAGNDTIYAGGGDDEVYGDADNDWIHGEGGHDELHGGTGDDTIYGGDGYDLIWGDDGNDTLYGGNDDDTIYGGAGIDVLYGDAGNDTLSGDAGGDHLYGGTGNDTMSGGTGNDSFYVLEGDGTSTMYGDDDWDTVDFAYSTGSAVDVTYSGDNAFNFAFDTGNSSGSGNSMENFILTGQNDTVDASLDATGATYDLRAGDDTFTGGSGNDAVYGGDGADTITLGAGGDYAEGGAGNDTIYGDAGEDWIEGGTGNDTLYGGDDADTFFYSDGWGSDTVFGGAGISDADTLDFSNVTTDVTVTFSDWEDGTATSGADSVNFDNIEAIRGGSGADTIDASPDGSGLLLDGGDGGDTIIGGSGDDELYGGDGVDTLFGGAGNDAIDGGRGDDTITGGAGDDTITSSNGQDTMVFADGFGNDIITDFDFTDSNSDGYTDDQLDVSALTDSDGNPVNAWDVVVSDDGLGNAVLTFPNGESITLTGIAPTQVDGAQQMHAIGIPCFVSGTRIMTPSGNRLIEELRHGDLVSTLNSGAQPILWAGRTTLKRARLALQPDLLPIRIRDGTLGNSGDLWVSPQHGLVLPDLCSHAKAGVLVRAKHLLEHGDGRVRRAKGSRDVTYHHLLLPRHALILANGCASESLFPGRFALSGFDRAAKAELFDLFPALETILRSGAPATDAARMYGQPVLRFAKGRDWRAGHIRLPKRA